MNLDRVSDTLHGSPTVVAPIRVGVRLAEGIHHGSGAALCRFDSQTLHRFIFRDLRRLKLVSVARQAADYTKRVVLARRGFLKNLHMQNGLTLLRSQCLDSLIRHAASKEEREAKRVSHTSLHARAFVFAADAGHIVRARNPRNGSVVLRLCGGSLWNLNAFFLLARHKEQREPYCYVTHGFPPAFDYTPEGI